MGVFYLRGVINLNKFDVNKCLFESYYVLIWWPKIQEEIAGT